MIVGSLRRVLPACLFLISLSPAFAQTVTTTASSHAPLGVMGDHQHKQGEWMASYRYGRMDMQGNRDGTGGVSRQEVLRDYMVAPLSMQMDMHMFGLMYGVTDNLTLMGMVPYIEKSMQHVNRMGRRFNTHTDGVGDIKATVLYTLYDEFGADGAHDHVHLNMGASLPTGSISERGDTPAGANQVLPYPMQLGSGTIDPLIGLTATRRINGWAYGGQGNATVRLGENSKDYRLGNEYNLTGWVMRDIAELASVSFRLDGRQWGNIHGNDTRLNPNMVPTARTDLRGGKRIDALIGVNLYQPEGMLKGHRLALEGGLPVYQHLDGPQLETDWRFQLGWQKSF